MAAGGGSGGHVTPVVAVIREIRKKHPRAEIRFWCDSKFEPQARSIIHGFDDRIAVQSIASGKFRRYHQYAWWRQIFRLRDIVLPNIRDGFLVVVGLFQSLWRMLWWRPDVVFCKGGFVCLPIGLAAKLLGIPLVIHDSDAHPGLTNRVLARFANQIATGAPLEYYSYPADRSRYVGIPVRSDFRPFDAEQRVKLKQKLGVDPNSRLVVVTGGGLGATRINNAVVGDLDKLLSIASVILISGTGQFDELNALTPSNEPRFQLHAFVSEGMADMLGAADVVVARAGATSLLELAALHKPTVLVPNGYLAGGHQLKNAKVYQDGGAVAVIDEHALDGDHTLLYKTLKPLLEDDAKLDSLSRAMASFAKPHAAEEMADIIISCAR